MIFIYANAKVMTLHDIGYSQLSQDEWKIMFERNRPADIYQRYSNILIPPGVILILTTNFRSIIEWMKISDPSRMTESDHALADRIVDCYVDKPLYRVNARNERLATHTTSKSVLSAADATDMLSKLLQ